MQNSQQYIDIVIPNYNGLRVLVPCLNSIARQAYPYIKVIVVDNGSTDGSGRFVCEKFPEIQLIALTENAGFSAAVNAGIMAGASPLVFLLNNDTELKKNCIQHLAQAAHSLTRYDFFVPKMLSFHDHSVIDGASDGFLRGGAGYRIGTMEKDSPIYSLPGPTFGACGGAALYRRSLFDQVGLFDEDFFAYLEDVDFNLRINRAGFHGYYVPAAAVYHIGSATSGSKINDFTLRLSTRNSFYVLLKHYQLSLLLRLLPVIIIYQLCWFVFCLKKGHIGSYAKGLAQVSAKAIVMRRKHAALRKKDRLTTAELALCLKKSEKNVVESIKRRRSAQGKKNTLLQLYEFFFL